jgi:uncharacterized protein (TIGR03643 family)
MANNILNNDLAHQLENKTDEQPGLAPVPRIDLMQHVIFSDQEIDRIIQMAWEDRTPFEAIEFQFGLKEKQVIEFMRKHSLPSSFRMWRKRMKSRKTNPRLRIDKKEATTFARGALNKRRSSTSLRRIKTSPRRSRVPRTTRFTGMSVLSSKAYRSRSCLQSRSNSGENRLHSSKTKYMHVCSLLSNRYM